LQPRLKLFPRPVVSADLAAPATLAAPHQQRSAARVEVGLGERERLADAQPGAPEHDDQRAQPATMDGVGGIEQQLGHDPGGSASTMDIVFSFLWRGAIVPGPVCVRDRGSGVLPG
jgi:hypothetical protein